MEAISKLENERLRSMAVAARAAQADKKSFKKFMQELK